jgi:hypothetical protein
VVLRFRVGAYAVAFMVKYLHVESMELFLVGAVAASILVTGLFGYVCVRYTKIFFSILTLALSQVLWSLAFKFFWVTGGTDGLRVPTPKLLGLAALSSDDKINFLSHGYYYYVLVRVRRLRGGDVAHRPFAVRKGAAGHPRQRDPGAIRRAADPALSLRGVLRLGHLYRNRRRALGTAQRPDDP